MKLSAGDVANGAAWIVFAVIIAVAVVIADALGFLGLLLIGAATWLVCSCAAQDEHPGWPGPQAFRSDAAITPTPRRLASPEERAARDAAWRATLNPIHFFGRCGMALTAVGAAGFAWQYWLAAASNGH